MSGIVTFGRARVSVDDLERRLAVAHYDELKQVNDCLLGVLLELRRERDQALGNLAMVLNNEDVAAVLDRALERVQLSSVGHSNT